MKRNIRATIIKMKSGKATDPESISVELLKALEDYGINEITTLLSEIGCFLMQHYQNK